MTDYLTRDEILALPVSQVVDGWVLRTGELYLWVQVSDKLVQTVVVPRGKAR